MRNKILIFVFSVLLILIVCMIFIECGNDSKISTKEIKIKEVKTTTPEKKRPLSFAEKYSEWICKDGDLEMTIVFSDTGNCMYAKTNNQQEVWVLNENSFNDKKTVVYLNPRNNDDISIYGFASIQNNVLTMDLERTDDIIGNKRQLVFKKINNNIPKLAVQAYARLAEEKLFMVYCPAYVRYMQISGDNEEGEIRMMCGVDDDKVIYDNTFTVKKRNESYDVYLNKEKVYTYRND